jgi:hypothetical protein
MRLSQVHPCLLALGFGNLAMLGWLAAAAAPILIHLWSRHRYRETPWAAMQFLLAAMQKNARRMQLQQWLLLALRMLIIALVVLAVAEPYGERLLAGRSALPAHKILVIDGSYSMAYQSSDRTNFANAKQIALQMVQQSNPADVFTVILMASPAKVVVSAELLDHAAVWREIESLVQAHKGADLASALALVRDALANTNGRDFPGGTEVYFLSDLQRCTWDAIALKAGDSKNKQQSEALKNFNAIAAAASITIIDLGQDGSSDVAVTSVSTSDQVITTERDIAFDAILHNFGSQRRDRHQAELLVDNVPIAEQRTNIGGNAEVQVRFRTRFNSTGSHAVTIRTTGDRLEIDNSRSLIVPVRSHIRVLCVAGREGAAKYVASALSPNPSGDSQIATVISEGDLAETDVKSFDCVFLCNVSQLSSNERGRLLQFVEGGGGLVTFLGDRILPASFNSPGPIQGTTLETRAPKVKSDSILPANIGELVGQQQSGIDPLEYRHPIVAPFRGRERSGLLTTPITHYYRLQTAKDRSTIEVAAAMRNGDPFIVTAKLGSGRTVLVATDASLSSVDPTSGEPWTTWPTWPSFLPIVRELMAYAIGGQQAQWEQPVGKALSGSLTNIAFDAAKRRLEIVRPDGHLAPVSIDTTSSERIWTYADTDLAGIYMLRGESKQEAAQFAVNVVTSESDLAKVNAAELPESVKVLSAWKGESTKSSATLISRGEWNESLLWTVFALLLVESLIASQFGRGVR